MKKKINIGDILVSFIGFSLVLFLAVSTIIEKNESLNLALYLIVIIIFSLYVSTIEKNKINLLYKVSMGYFTHHVILYLFFNSKNIALISYVDSPFITSSINITFSCFVIALVSVLKKII